MKTAREIAKKHEVQSEDGEPNYHTDTSIVAAMEEYAQQFQRQETLQNDSYSPTAKWITNDIRVKVKQLWNKENTGDNPRVEAVKLVQQIGEQNGFKVDLKKAKEICEGCLKQEQPNRQVSKEELEKQAEELIAKNFKYEDDYNYPTVLKSLIEFSCLQNNKIEAVEFHPVEFADWLNINCFDCLGKEGRKLECSPDEWVYINDNQEPVKMKTTDLFQLFLTEKQKEK